MAPDGTQCAVAYQVAGGSFSQLLGEPPTFPLRLLLVLDVALLALPVADIRQLVEPWPRSARRE